MIFKKNPDFSFLFPVTDSCQKDKAAPEGAFMQDSSGTASFFIHNGVLQ